MGRFCKKYSHDNYENWVTIILSRKSIELLYTVVYGHLYCSTMQFLMWSSMLYLQNISAHYGDGEEGEEDPFDETKSNGYHPK